MKHKPKYVAQYVALRVFAGIFNILPHRVALFVAWLLAGFAFHVVRYRVSRAKARIREVFGDRYSAKEVNRIAWISLRNTLFNIVEVARLPKIDRKWLEERVEWKDAVEAVEGHRSGGKGAILSIPHMGNWDMGGFGIQAFDVPIFFLVGRQHNQLVDAYTNRLRSSSGIETIPRGDGALLRKVIRNLKDGKILGFMTDLRSKTKGVSVRFLGKEANVVAGMALFARQAKVPIVPSVVTRIGWSRHKWEAFEPVVADPSVDKEQDFQRMTQEVMDVYEKAIREQPEQYFWYNNRWILMPFVEPKEEGEDATEAQAGQVAPEAS